MYRETRDRVVREYSERGSAAPREPSLASFRRLHEVTGVPKDTISGWDDWARVDAGEKPGVATAEREGIKALRREVAVFRRADGMLQTASALLASAELDRRFTWSSRTSMPRSSSPWVEPFCRVP